jgi:hypothetical protein
MISKQLFEGLSAFKGPIFFFGLAGSAFGFAILAHILRALHIIG